MTLQHYIQRGDTKALGVSKLNRLDDSICTYELVQECSRMSMMAFYLGEGWHHCFTVPGDTNSSEPSIR